MRLSLRVAAKAALTRIKDARLEPEGSNTFQIPHIKKPPQGWFLYMAHSGGFEPPTARFVAEYSIQLSYECVRPRNILIGGL